MKKYFCYFILMLSCNAIVAQDSLLLQRLNDSLADNTGKTYVQSTFKASRIVNMQTVETLGAGSLLFVIQHRFGQLNSGAYNFFGLDNATLRLGLDYGITNQLTIGLGRSSFEKTIDAYAKYKLIQQSTGSGSFPLSICAFGRFGYFNLKYPDKPFLNATYRSSYVGQLLIARKFSSNFSLQITPTYLHYNLVPTVNDKNDQLSIGGGGRLKITRRTSINVEYNYLLPNQMVSMPVYNSFSVGYDIETGGHVFQLIVTNSQGMIESQYVGKTIDSWSNGGIYFGFNISRNFNIGGKHKNK